MQYRKTLKKRAIKGFKGFISILMACLALDWLMLNFQWYTSLPQYHWTDSNGHPANMIIVTTSVNNLVIFYCS